MANPPTARVSMMLSPSSLLRLRSEESEEEARTAAKAKLRNNFERTLDDEFQRWSTRSFPKVPKLPSFPSPKAAKLHDLIALRQAALRELQLEWSWLQRLSVRPSHASDSDEMRSEVTDLVERCGAVERENESYGELVMRLKDDVAEHKKRSEDMRKAVETVQRPLQVLRNKTASDSISHKEVINKRNQAEKALWFLRKERLALLKERLEESESSRATVEMRKSEVLDRKMVDFEKKQAVNKLKFRLESIESRLRSTAALREYHDTRRREYQSIRVNFESLFGTSDPEEVLSRFRRTSNRSEMLRREVEEMLLGESRARKELEELAKMKEELTSKQTANCEEQRPISETRASISPSLKSKQNLVYLALASLSNIYKATIDKDPLRELSQEYPLQPSLSVLLLLVEKRLVTAICIASQSQPKTPAKKVPQPSNPRSLHKKQSIREENHLKLIVMHDHFLLNSAYEPSKQHITTTIDSMLSGAASLLTQPNREGKGGMAAGKRQWKNEESELETAQDRAEFGYWKETRKKQKPQIAVRHISSTPQLRFAPNPSPTYSRTPKPLSIAEFSSVISDLRRATKQVKKLKNLSRRAWETLPTVSTPNSSKTKDTSIASPRSLRVPNSSVYQ